MRLRALPRIPEVPRGVFPVCVLPGSGKARLQRSRAFSPCPAAVGPRPVPAFPHKVFYVFLYFMTVRRKLLSKSACSQQN